MKPAIKIAREEEAKAVKLNQIERLTIKIALAKKAGNIGLEDCLTNQLKQLKGIK